MRRVLFSGGSGMEDRTVWERGHRAQIPVPRMRDGGRGVRLPKGGVGWPGWDGSF